MLPSKNKSDNNSVLMKRPDETTTKKKKLSSNDDALQSENDDDDDDDDVVDEEEATAAARIDDEDDDEMHEEDDEDDDDEFKLKTARDDDEDDEDEDDDILNENINEQLDTVEIEFDPSKHVQHLTLNEMTRIIININDMVNNNVLQVPISMTKADYIYTTIVEDRFETVIRRPIDLHTCIRVNLSQLKIDKVKLRQKLDRLFAQK